ncbi:nucleotidyltransferase domain-containing protein [Nocardia sp. R6R-6]|uniref:nucleotidyltransferase domain-containing protein n=1 Tax=Nocardia sp. R6R-6 TaxID=3459303 RepID=UPI00403DC983
MDTTTLARRIITSLPGPDPAVTLAAREVADSLRKLGELVPARDWLIVGGSLARGEPSFTRTSSEEPKLLSDIDLLYVHSGERPSTSLREVLSLAETVFPAVELMSMPVKHYQAVSTSLGHDFKNIGVPLTRHGLPPHTRVRLDERDAYEILLYYVMCWFWSGLSESWFDGDATTEFHLTVNRLCMKVLRATAMLDGAYRHHDLHLMAPPVAERMRAELSWRNNPLGRPADPGRFWSYLDEAFRRFDARFGRPRPDAVAFSPYAHTPSGHIVAEYQQTAQRLGRSLAHTWVATGNCADVATVVPSAWARITGWTGTNPPQGPRQYFREHRTAIHDHLLAMKVQV